MTRELKYKAIVLENFVPLAELKKVEDRLQYDEEAETYTIQPITSAKK